MINMINIVLFEPEIPENTGNITRTCYCFNFNLHLIRPYGFIFDLNKIKRSSTNHIDMNKIFEYDDWDEFVNKNKISNNIYFYTKNGSILPNQMEFQIDQDYFIVFGKESSGIPKNILNKFNSNKMVRIPMVPGVVSMNLSNAVAIAGYEIVKQLNYKGLK